MGEGDFLYAYEEKLMRRGIELVAGVDEAGRGPLAGPVVAAAVILPPGSRIPGLDDSKKLPARLREELAWRIKRLAVDWAIGLATVAEIALLNIHHASLLAMRRAVLGLSVRPQYLLVDGRFTLDLPVPQEALVGGDGRCACIAAASILAKVTRDHLMEACHHLFPQYGFDKHKGYPTPAHRRALASWGPCPLHRPGFKGVERAGEF
ncbi:ribonuclease HII [Desulfovirgula thermocuniculi]|uniref:ribonuclease HII n=1 Tax=Desulfovirgula thermocuniculi TaxID=348842 RepID=UPI00040670E9|nr:ribonuclease HII [Desulfovirgula thermocuniculi]